MAAIIGLEHADVVAVCTEASTLGACQIANDNGGGQIVISGEKAAVEKAAELATAKGAKRAILLPVSAPFHSTLMAPAAEAMRAALGRRCEIQSGRACHRQCSRGSGNGRR